MFCSNTIANGCQKFFLSNKKYPQRIAAKNHHKSSMDVLQSICSSPPACPNPAESQNYVQRHTLFTAMCIVQLLVSGLQCYIGISMRICRLRHMDQQGETLPSINQIKRHPGRDPSKPDPPWIQARLPRCHTSSWWHPLPVREEHHVKVTHVASTGIAKCSSGLQNTKGMKVVWPSIESEPILSNLSHLDLTLIKSRL